MIMSLNGINTRSLPELGKIEIHDVPDINLTRLDAVSNRSEARPRHSKRAVKATWKAREDIEEEFWQELDSAKEILLKSEGMMGHSFIVRDRCAGQAKDQIDRIDDVYTRLRLASRIVPADVHQAADRIKHGLGQVERNLI